MKFQDFKTVDGVSLVDLENGVCWLISGQDVTERRMYLIDVWQKRYAIVDPNGNGYHTGTNPETCLYADPKVAYRKIIENAQATCNATVQHVAERLAAIGGVA